MATYSYITKSGSSSTFDAADSQSALSILGTKTDRDPNSGVQLYTAPTTTPGTPTATASPTTTTAPSATSSTTDTFLKAIQDRLMDSSGAVSSQDSDMDSLFKEIISGTQKSGEATRSGIEAFYDRQREDVKNQLPEDLKNAAEARSGFATNMAVLKQIFQDTDKAIKDLDLREQEALAAGDSATAAKIAELKLSQLQMKTQAQQQTYQNLISAAGLSMNADQLAMQKETNLFNQTIQKFDFLAKNNLLTSIDSDSKRSLEAELGLPDGILDKVKTGTPLNLQTVAGVGLVNVWQDEDGKTHTDILMPSKNTSGTNPEDAIINKFGAVLADPSKLAAAGTREQFIRQLIAQFPQISESSIADYVYNTYPDNYRPGSSNDAAINYYVDQIHKGNMDISTVPADVRTAVASKL